jgi:hypothetical protein
VVSFRDRSETRLICPRSTLGDSRRCRPTISCLPLHAGRRASPEARFVLSLEARCGKVRGAGARQSPINLVARQTHRPAGLCFEKPVYSAGSDPFDQVAPSPTGSHLLTKSSWGEVRLWDVGSVISAASPMKISARTVQTRVWIRSSSIIAQIPFCGFQCRILPKCSGKSGFSYPAIMMWGDVSLPAARAQEHVNKRRHPFRCLLHSLK